MVFLSLINFVRVRGPDRFWRKRKVYQLTQHFSRRKRNCYSIAIRALHHALLHATKARQIKKVKNKLLWETRLEGVCNELNTSSTVLLEGLARSNVLLDRKILNDLAIWEPRTFKCLTDVAATKFNLSPPRKARLTLDPPPDGVVTRGML